MWILLNCCWGKYQQKQDAWSITLNLSQLILPAIFLKQHCLTLSYVVSKNGMRWDKTEGKIKNSVTSQILLSPSRSLQTKLFVAQLPALLLSPDTCRADSPQATMKLYPSSFSSWHVKDNSSYNEEKKNHNIWTECFKKHLLYLDFF